MAPQDMAALRDSGMVFMDRKSVRGFGECTPAYDYLLANGLKRLKEKAQAKLDALDDARFGDLEKSFFYRAEIMACDGMILLAKRHAELAERMASECSDPVRRAELVKIAEVCRCVPEYPAETFHEACQFMMFYQYAIFMEQNASSYNPDRVDQFLYPYYLADIRAGRATDDDIQELLDCTWIKIAEMSLFQDAANAEYSAGYCITQQVTLGGITRSGDDTVNELSYMAIQAAMDVRMKEPNVSIRYNISKNPDPFLRKAVEAIRTGLSMPAVYHDDAGIRMMMNKGVPLRDAWNWNPCGCVETNLAGKLKGYTAVGDFNMGGVIEMVMNNGVSRKTGEQCSIQTGDPRTFKTFEEFVDAVKRQIDYFMDAAVSGDQLLDYLSALYRPVPVLSLSIPYCMEHGGDYSYGGADYNCGGSMISVGQADIVNSLAAVKYLVYDEKKLTMDTLCRALDADFVGYEDVRELCLAAPKYGNDDERADLRR